jgi:Holliday junction resolvase-like predicted endonuclease
MFPRDKAATSLAEVRGRWGEHEAVRLLLRKGFRIVARNVRPVKSDRRLEIDIVAYDVANDTLVFVEVKQHASHSAYERRLRSIDKRKMKNLRRACFAWLHANRWKDAYRFDVIEVFGVPGSQAECDHIERVSLFVNRERFVKWN